MCFIAEDGYAAVQNATAVKRSKKAARCDDCYKTIPVGSSYKRIESLYDGSWGTARICMSCLGLRKAIVEVELAEGCSHYEAEPLLGALGEQLGHDAERYHKELLGIGRFEEASWLAEICNVEPQDDL